MSKLPQQSFRLKHVLWALMGLLASSSIHPARGQSFSEEHGQYRYRAVFVENPPTVDGDLSDPAWEKAAVIDQLIQQEPDTGAPSGSPWAFDVVPRMASH